MTPIRVLIVDDHGVTREGMSRLLAGEADLAVVGEAADGRAALRLAEASRPDVVLLDLRLPGLDGLQVARALRRRLPSTRVVALTGYDENEQYARALVGLGVRGYLSKAVSGGEVARAIRAVHGGGTAFPPRVLERLGQARAASAAERPTARELETLALVARGLSNRELAIELGVSERTAQFHLRNIFAKLGVNSRTALVDRARARGWLP
jgi:DNA-binding NarL/FixJ family response regulator